VRLISASDCQAALDHETLIGRLRDAFRRGASLPPPAVYEMPRVAEPPARLTLSPAWYGERAAGLGIATAIPGNPSRDLPVHMATYLLLDGRSGAPRALIDGAMLHLRAAAARSALAASYLARPDSDRLLMLGAGDLAAHLVPAFAEVRPIRNVLVWDRRPEEARRLARGLDRRRLKVEATEDLAGALAGADIVCSTVEEAIVPGAALQAGQHLDLAGGAKPERRQTDDEAIRRARVFVDSREAATQLADLANPLASGLLVLEDIAADLSELARGERAGRRFYRQITLFKAAGTALEDLAAAQLAWERA